MDTELIQLMLKDKRIRLTLLAVCVLLLIYFLFSFVTNAHLTVTTNDSNNVILLTKAGKNGSQSTVGSTQGKTLSVTVRGGSYEISVNNQRSGITKDVVVKARQNEKYELDISAPTAPVSVLPDGASALAANGQALYYLNPNSSVYRLSSDGVPAPVSGVQFVSAQWANASFGVGQGQDGILYSIINGSVSPLAVPFNYKSGSKVSYSASPAGMVYVSSGGTVYAGQNGQNFKKFFGAGSDSLSLFAGKNAVAIAESANNDSGTNGTVGPGESPDNLIIVSAAGKKTASSKIDVSSLVWSPGSSKLAIAGDDGQENIYSASLSKIGTISKNTSPVVWTNDNTMVYGQSGNLREYDLKHKQSFTLSTTPEGESISKVFLSDELNYVYFSAINLNTQNQILLRVGLNAQANNVPPYYSGLSVLFPNNTQQCSFSYSIFNKPYILITGWQDKNACMQQAQSELKLYELPVSGFNIAYPEPVANE